MMTMTTTTSSSILLLLVLVAVVARQVAVMTAAKAHPSASASVASSVRKGPQTRRRRRKRRRLHHPYHHYHPYNDNFRRELQITAESACRASAEREQEAGADFGAVCECRPFQQEGDDDQAILTCVDTLCWYCDQDATVCDEFSYGVVFDAQGEEMEYWEQDVYKVGRTEVLKYTEYATVDEEDEDDSDGGGGGDECLFEINGNACQACRFVDCDDGEYFGMEVDCTNLLGEETEGTGATFNSCDDSQQHSSGIFQLFHDDFGYCYGAQDGCEWAVDEYSQEYTCECVEKDTDNIYQLTCQSNCDQPICNVDTGTLDTCIQEASITQTYPTLLKDRQIRTITVDDKTVQLEESSCNDTGCQECVATIGDTTCNSCIMQSCGTDLVNPKMPVLDCSNIQSEWNNLDLCNNSTATTSSPMDYFGGNASFQCMSTAGMACLQARQQRQAQDDPHLECKCELDTSTATSSSVVMTCETSCGDVCSGNICFRETLQQSFTAADDEPNDASSLPPPPPPPPISRTIQYTHGLRQTLVYTELDDTSCELTVDGTLCQTCQREDCSGMAKILVDCSNVDPTAVVVDSCDDSSEHDGGFLMRLTTTKEELEDCQVKSAANTQCDKAETMEFSTDQAMGSANAVGSTILLPLETDQNIPSCNTDTVNVSPGLWYRVKGRGSGMEASVCHEQTDFDAQISVFTGSSCDDEAMECVTATMQGTDCSVQWFAMKDATYFLRVHGIDEASTGNFQLSLKEFDYTPELCIQRKEEMETIDSKQYSCECLADEDSSLRCENQCVMCNDAMTICGREQVYMKFDNTTASVVQHTESFEYLFGKPEGNAMVVEQNLCPPDMEQICQPSCHVAVDGVPCDSCKMVSCNGEENDEQHEVALGLDIICDNVDSSVTMNTCDKEEAMDVSQSSSSQHAILPSMLYQDNLEHCISMNGHLACLHEQTILSSKLDEMECHCEEQKDDSGGFHLTCVDTSCLKCDEKRRFCGFDTIQSEYSLTGDPGKSYNGFLVMEGNAQTDRSSEELSQVMELTGCTSIQDPQTVCQQERTRMIAADSSMACECQKSNNGDGGYNLLCAAHPSCEYCDEAGDLCAQPVQIGQRISQFGHLVDHSYHTFMYTEGRDEVVMVELDGDDDCMVSVNGEQCSQCRRMPCQQNSFSQQDNIEISSSPTRTAAIPTTTTETFLELFIDCSNVFEGLYQNVSNACGVTTMVTESYDDGNNNNNTLLSGKGVTMAIEDDDDSSIFAIFTGRMEYACRDNETTITTVIDVDPSTPTQAPAPTPRNQSSTETETDLYDSESMAFGLCHTKEAVGWIFGGLLLLLLLV
jgi:hypothetical protein